MNIQRVSALVAASFLGISTTCFSSGFQLFEENAASTSNFGAGSAAVAEDASTAFFNPAGLTRIKKPQIAGSLVGIFFNTKFTGSSTWRLLSMPLAPTYTETGSVSGGGFSPVPSFHFAAPLSDRFVGAFSVTSPFGLSTEYSTTSILRYAATKSKLLTINYSPAFGVRLTDHLSLGAGLDIQYASVEFHSVGGFPIIPPPTGRDNISENFGKDYGHGWHGGLLYSMNQDNTRFGINYQSGVHHLLHGTSELTGPFANGGAAGTQVSDKLTGKIKLPETTTVSFYHAVNPQWAVMGSAAYTAWSVFKEIRLDNVAGLNPLNSMPANNIIAESQQNYRDTWRFVMGVDHQVNDRLRLRSGLAYDQSPVNDHDRSVRLPDGDRVALAMGLHYQATPKVGLEFGYTHLFVQDTKINNSLANGNPVNTGHLPNSSVMSQGVDVIGSSRTSADLIGAQMTVDLS